MKCPNCQHHSETVLLKCSACGESYERGALEELQHLEYLLAWLESQADSLGDRFEALQTQVAWDLANVRSGLLPERVETPAVTPVAPELAPPVPIPAPTPIPTQKPIPAPTYHAPTHPRSCRPRYRRIAGISCGRRFRTGTGASLGGRRRGIAHLDASCPDRRSTAESRETGPSAAPD
jgi:hypothetical protein